jgi:C4-dicarboxylate-specific signal transduction histidine kinase
VKLSEQVLRAGEIVHHLRDFMNKKQAVRTALCVNELVRQVIALVDTELQESGIQLEIDLPLSLPNVRVNRIQVQQVILNRVRNAAEALAGGEASPRRIWIIASAPCDGWVEIAVRDSGPGIVAENAGRVFEAFFSTKADGRGMGLGISRSIIEDHGGRLWAEASPDHGATLRLSLPAERGDAA